MRISDWSSDVCSSDLAVGRAGLVLAPVGHHDGDLVIVGVDVFLHGSGPLKRRAVYLRPRFGASLGLPGKSPDFRGFSAALGLWLQKAQYAALCPGAAGFSGFAKPPARR